MSEARSLSPNTPAPLGRQTVLTFNTVHARFRIAVGCRCDARHIRENSKLNCAGSVCADIVDERRIWGARALAAANDDDGGAALRTTWRAVTPPLAPSGAAMRCTWGTRIALGASRVWGSMVLSFMTVGLED